jgi:acetyl-CoA carboxylase alpha subunit
VPIITIVGEGASGGALGIGVETAFYVGKHLVFGNFTRITLILWKSWEYMNKLRSFEIDFIRHETELIDDIIPEPLEEHITIERPFKTVQQYIMKVIMS